MKIHAVFLTKWYRCGEIKRLVMGLDRFAKTPCGFCFVEYYTHQDALDCMKYIGGTKLDERIIRTDLDPGFQEGRQYGYVFWKCVRTSTNNSTVGENLEVRFEMNIEMNTIRDVEDMDERLPMSDGRRKRNTGKIGRLVTPAGACADGWLAKYVYSKQMNQKKIYLELNIPKTENTREIQNITSLLSPQMCCFFPRGPLSCP